MISSTNVLFALKQGNIYDVSIHSAAFIVTKMTYLSLLDKRDCSDFHLLCIPIYCNLLFLFLL